MAQMSKSGKVQQLAKAEPVEDAVVDSRVRIVRADVDDGFVATATSKSQHVINQGETLSGIAQQYGVSMRALRMANGMDDGNVRVGQVLQIPRNS
jgi:N-acetylmuramoyl-L-alanine amidase